MPKVLLTGAAGGIGVATARRLWEKGFQLVLTDLSLSALERAFPEVPSGSSLEPLDVQSLENWGEIAERHSDTEILIQLAGVMRVGKFLEQPIELWHLQQGVNLTGLVYGAWVFGRRFAERGHGHLIHVASLAGIAPVPGIAAYTATKFGVRGFSLALDLELRPQGVPVTVICPGPVATPLIWNELPKPESVYTLAAGGLLEPEAVARAIERAIWDRPPEIALPAHKARAARLVGAFPRLLPWAVRFFTKGAAQRRAKYLQTYPTPSQSTT
ncbi:MAG: SDR family NAD(P)-dependent oxidoreductase [Bacteroidia bacterium]